MVQVSCTDIYRDEHNLIYGYRIVDMNGCYKDVTPTFLKKAIKNQQIRVTNLTLTKDNRLVKTTNGSLKQLDLGPMPLKKKRRVPKLNKNLENELNNGIKEAKGYIDIYHLIDVSEDKYTIDTACGNNCYLINRNKIDHIVLIPENVTKLNNILEYRGNEIEFVFTKHIKNLKGTIRVIGGSGLKDITGMFCNCEASEIDVTQLNTINVTNMAKAFYGCKAKRVTFSKIFDTRNVKNMSNMFAFCATEELDLYSFNTVNVISMSRMFYCCLARRLNIKSFNTRKVAYMGNMFSFCRLKELDISHFSTKNIEEMHGLFENSYIENLRIKIKLNCTEYNRGYSMFFGLITDTLDLRNSQFDIFKEQFNYCCAIDIILDDTQLNNIGKDNIDTLFENCYSDIYCNDKIIRKIDTNIYKDKVNRRKHIQITELNKRLYSELGEENITYFRDRIAKEIV